MGNAQQPRLCRAAHVRGVAQQGAGLQGGPGSGAAMTWKEFKEEADRIEAEERRKYEEKILCPICEELPADADQFELITC